VTQGHAIGDGRGQAVAREAVEDHHPERRRRLRPPQRSTPTSTAFANYSALACFGVNSTAGAATASSFATHPAALASVASAAANSTAGAVGASAALAASTFVGDVVVCGDGGGIGESCGGERGGGAGGGDGGGGGLVAASATTRPATVAAIAALTAGAAGRGCSCERAPRVNPSSGGRRVVNRHSCAAARSGERASAMGSSDGRCVPLEVGRRIIDFGGDSG